MDTDNANSAQFREIIIPGDVLDDERLSDGAKIMYGKIARLSYKTGYCWATNAFLDNTKSGSTAKRQIKELIDAGFLKSHIDTYGIRKIYICKIDSKVEEVPQTKNGLPPPTKKNKSPAQKWSTPQTKNGLPPDQKWSTPQTKNGLPTPAKNDPQTLQDSTNLNLTAAAGPPEPPADPAPGTEPAAAAPITSQELKEALLGVDKALYLKSAFYPKAVAFMAQHGLDRGYIAWLYRQCEQKKPDTSFKGLYYTLFFEEDMAEQYAALRRASAALRKPPPPIICPACGATHERGDDNCPSCGLRKDSTEENIMLFRDLHSLPPEKRAEYIQREKSILEEYGKDFVRSASLIRGLKREFGLAAGL